jgi:hypothetical protein
VISIRPAIHVFPALTRPKKVTKLAAVLARRYGGDGEAQLRRLCRIAASDVDPRSMQSLRVLLSALYSR